MNRDQARALLYHALSGEAAAAAMLADALSEGVCQPLWCACALRRPHSNEPNNPGALRCYVPERCDDEVWRWNDCRWKSEHVTPFESFRTPKGVHYSVGVLYLVRVSDTHLSLMSRHRQPMYFEVTVANISGPRAVMPPFLAPR